MAHIRESVVQPSVLRGSTRSSGIRFRLSSRLAWKVHSTKLVLGRSWICFLWSHVDRFESDLESMVPCSCFSWIGVGYAGVYGLSSDI